MALEEDRYGNHQGCLVDSFYPARRSEEATQSLTLLASSSIVDCVCVFCRVQPSPLSVLAAARLF
jgi:hypothetical protein